MGSLLRAFACIIAGAIPTSVAAGTMQVCNHLNAKINIAFAYSDHKLGPVTKGWWIVEPGKCTAQFFRGHGNVVYIYAAFSNGNAVLDNSSFQSTSLCVQLTAFQDDFRKHVRDNKLNCEVNNMMPRNFRKVAVPGDQNFVYTIKPHAPQVPSAPNPPVGSPAPRPSPPPAATPAPPPGSVPSGPAPNAPNACQMFPNLC